MSTEQPLTYEGVVGETDQPFVILDEVTAPDLSKPPPSAPDDLVVHATLLSGDVHRVAGHINERLPEFVGGILGIQFNGTHSSVALIRAPRAQIEKAKREGRL